MPYLHQKCYPFGECFAPIHRLVTHFNSLAADEVEQTPKNRALPDLQSWCLDEVAPSLHPHQLHAEVKAVEFSKGISLGITIRSSSGLLHCQADSHG